MVEASPASDVAFMTRALELAVQGRGWTSPSPMSGAVVAKGNELLGEGFSSKPGHPHAEIFALDAAGEAARDADLFVVNEPCAQRNGCVSRIIEAGIRRVIVACEDPIAALAGKGIAQLRAEGIEVEVGVERARARRINEAAIKFLTTRRPFVALNAVMSFDGKTATAIGERPVPPPEVVDDLRSSYDAVMVGVGTVLNDDPDLTTASPRSRNPLRIVIDGMARTPPGCKFLSRQGTRGLRPAALIVTTRFAPDDRVRALQEGGAEVVVAPEEEESMTGDVDLAKLMAILGRRDIASVLVEGEGSLIDAALAAQVIDKVHAYMAPVLLGGSSAPSLVGGVGVSFVEEAQRLHGLEARPCGDGLLLEGYLEPR